jgi:hypothetical protein
MPNRRKQKLQVAAQPEPTVGMPPPLMVGRMKVSKPAVRQGGWDELQLFRVTQNSQEILDELQADARLNLSMAKNRRRNVH